MTEEADLLTRARRYAALGLCVIPLKFGTKKPDLDSWAEYQTRRPTEAELMAWFGNGTPRNIGIVLGKISGVVVVESDSPEAEAQCEKHLPRPRMMTRTARGLHRYFRRPGKFPLPASISLKGVTVEIKRDGQYVVAPPSVHPSGHVYTEVEPWPGSLDALPEISPESLSSELIAQLLDGGAVASSAPAEPLPEAVGDGGRNKTLFREGCRLRRLGLEQPEILAALSAINQHRCRPPLPLREVESIAKGAAKYEPGGDSFPLTEAGDAAFFALQYANDVRFDHRAERWLVLDDASGIWLPDTDGYVTRLALATMRARQQQSLKIGQTTDRKRAADWALKGESRARLTNMLALAQDFEPIADSGENWDAIAHLLGTPTGVVDLRTGVVRRADPQERITMRTSVPFDPAARSDLWEKTLASIFPEADERAYLQIALGYTTTGGTNLDRWFLPNGPKGRDGKGTILGAVRAALADYALEVDAATFDRRKEGTPFNLAKLPGKRFVHCAEAGDSTTLHHDRIKQISGGDEVMAGDKHQRAFSFRPVCKLWFSCNTRPKVSDESAAFWARVAVILFRNIDADLLEQRVALRGNATTPDQKRVDLMVSHLLKHTPEDIAGFYHSATDAERREMEAASVTVGRVPTKGAGGGREWKTLLDPAMVEEAVLARAEIAKRIRDFRTYWRKACEQAGYPGKLLHDFRRSAVRSLERSGVPRSTAMAMVGHKTVSIYQRYAIVDEAMLQEGGVKLDAFTVEQKAKAHAEAERRRGQLVQFEERLKNG